MAGFMVAGFDIDAPLGCGWGGELWAARGRATGRPVVLRRLAVADDLASHDRVRRAAARLVDVRHPHLVRLRGVLSVAGAVVLVHDHVPGVALDRLLAERGHLDEAQVVSLAVALAEALAAVHARGLGHGRVSASSVLLSADGRPVLADTGVAGLLDDDRACGPGEDVRELALTCRAALGPTVQSGRLAAVLAAATVDDPSRRPSAAELAAAVFATGSAAPILPGRGAPARAGRGRDVVGPVDHPPRRHRRSVPGAGRSKSRRWLGVLVALGAVSAAALTGLAWAGADAHTPGSTVAAHGRSSYGDMAVAARWRSVLAALDARRASAFAAGSPRHLAEVYAEDSPALRRDCAALADLAASGLHVEGLRLRARSVRLVTRSARQVVLEVVDVLEPYEVRGAKGVLVERRPGRGAASWRVTLVRSGSEWQFYDVVAS
jgi:hypothetical protein